MAGMTSRIAMGILAAMGTETGTMGMTTLMGAEMGKMGMTTMMGAEMGRMGKAAERAEPAVAKNGKGPARGSFSFWAPCVRQRCNQGLVENG